MSQAIESVVHYLVGWRVAVLAVIIAVSFLIGLVAGGGLTVIAHAPNPAGLSLLRKYFKGGVSPWNLFVAALPATIVFLILFYVFKVLI